MGHHWSVKNPSSSNWCWKDWGHNTTFVRSSDWILRQGVWFILSKKAKKSPAWTTDGQASASWVAKDWRHNTDFVGSNDGIHRQEVWFILSKKAKKSLIWTTSVSEHFIDIRFKGSTANMSIILVYIPNSSRSDEDSEEFFSQLQSLTYSIPKKDIIPVTGHFNAVFGSKSDVNEDVMGKFGHRARNRRGRHLLEYCRENELIEAKTIFKYREWRKGNKEITWRNHQKRFEKLSIMALHEKIKLIKHFANFLFSLFTV